MTELEEKKEETKEEKKENAFSKFFKKTKESVSNTVLDVKLANRFNEDNEEAYVYSGSSITRETVYGYMEDGSFIALGEHEFKKNSIFMLDDKPYHILSVSEAVVKIALDGFEYEKKATKYELDSNVTEVNVIKVEKHYYLVRE